ncbi:hypothetical protein, partial [Candidatus Accumulibacter vicinus]|uniref:hypothetical protein n=1 Tax=Candidatus Accumulibacter vicinus TaxID=2954382 RepID=UPI00235B5F1E
MLRPSRATCRPPQRETTGTPIHRASQEQTIAISVAGQIDEDVDAIATNARGQFVVVEIVAIDPAVGMPAEKLGHLVGAVTKVVAADLESLMVMVLDDRQQEVAHGVAAEVTRQIADAQSPSGVGRVERSNDQAGQRRDHPRVELAMCGENLLIRGFDRKIQQHGPVALYVRIVDCPRRRAVMRKTLGAAPLRQQHIAEVQARQRVIRIEVQHRTVAAFGGGDLALLLQGLAEVVMRLGCLRIEFDGALQVRQRRHWL